MEQFEIYKFINKEWVGAKSISERDIALIIDKSERKIYIWEGPFSNPRQQVIAKENLEIFKGNYPDYKFRLLRKLEEQDPQYNEIQKLLPEIILDSSEYKKRKERDMGVLYKYAKLAGQIASVLLLIVLAEFLALLSPDVLNNSQYEHIFFKSYKEFEDFISMNVIFSLIACSLLIIAQIIAYLIKNYRMLILLLITTIIVYIMVFQYWGQILRIIFNNVSDLTKPFVITAEIMINLSAYTAIIYGGLLIVIGFAFITLPRYKNVKLELD